MMLKPRSDLVPNTADYENLPLVTANGFREYDARWLFGKEINLLGIQALGLGLGTYLQTIGVQPKVFIPIAAKHGDNIASLSKNMPWWQGPTVLATRSSTR